jgi:hypothetical protein
MGAAVTPVGENTVCDYRPTVGQVVVIRHTRIGVLEGPKSRKARSSGTG